MAVLAVSTGSRSWTTIDKEDDAPDWIGKEIRLQLKWAGGLASVPVSSGEYDWKTLCLRRPCQRSGVLQSRRCLAGSRPIQPVTWMRSQTASANSRSVTMAISIRPPAKKLGPSIIASRLPPLAGSSARVARGTSECSSGSVAAATRRVSVALLLKHRGTVRGSMVSETTTPLPDWLVVGFRIRCLRGYVRAQWNDRVHLTVCH